MSQFPIASGCLRSARSLEKSFMRRRWVWVVAALAVGIGTVVLGFGVPRLFSLVHPARELRSYATLPPALAQPGFRAGPIFAGLSVDQELALSPRDAAIRLWVGPARAGDPARARIELLAGPHGPSLRSGEIDLTSGSEALVARVAPPLREHELGAGGRVLLRIVATADSTPIQVGMARDDSYRPGQAFIAGPMGEDVNVMFEVARTVPHSELWSEVWHLINSETLPGRAIAAWVPIALVAVLAARVSTRERWVHAALVAGLLALAAAAIVVVDRASLSLFPGPDFDPTMVLR